VCEPLHRLLTHLFAAALLDLNALVIELQTIADSIDLERPWLTKNAKAKGWLFF
jgi:hypothetical protein